jgi:WD40 repeat protein
MLKRLHFGYDSDRGILASASGPQKVQIWRTDAPDDADADQRAPDLELSTERSKIVGLHLQPGGLLVTVHETGAVAAWELSDADGALDAELQWEESFDFTPALVDGSDRGEGHVAVAGKLGDLVLIELGDDATVTKLDGHDAEITALCFDDSGSRLASGARDHKLFVWDVGADGDEATSPAADLDGCESWPLSMAFSSDGARLAAGAMDNGVYLWAVGSGTQELAGCVFEHHGWVVDVAWAPDDSVVAAASWDNTIGIYGREKLRPRYVFEFHRDYVSALCFHGDNLYSGGYDQKVCRWLWREPEFAGVVEAHSDWVLGMIELAEGRIATFSSDHSVRIWDVPAFELVETLGSGITSSFDLGSSVDMSSFVDGSSPTRDQLEDKRPPRAEMPPGRLDAVRTLDGTGSSGTAKTAFGMLESQLGGDDLDADSAFEADEDLLEISDSITTEYASESDATSHGFVAEPTDEVDPQDVAETARADAEDASTREVDPDEIDPSAFDLSGEMEQAPELEVDSGAMTAGDAESADDLVTGSEANVGQTSALDIDSEELASAADETPSDVGEVDLELDADLGPTDPDEVSLDVEDAAPEPEKRAEEALDEESAAAAVDDEVEDEAPVEPDVELDPKPEEPPSDALDQLESSMEQSSPDDQPDAPVGLDAAEPASDEDDATSWADDVELPDDADADEPSEEAVEAPDEAEGDDEEATADVEASLDVDEPGSDAAEEFVSSDFSGDEDEQDELGSVSSGSLSAGDPDASIEDELDQVPLGGVGLDEGSSKDKAGMGDLLEDAPDDLGLGDISSADLSSDVSGDLDVELGSDGEGDMPGLDEVSFPDDLDIESDSLQTQAEVEDPSSPVSSEARPTDDAHGEEKDAEGAAANEQRARQKRTPGDGDAEEAEDDSDEDEQGLAPDSQAATKKTSSLKNKLKAALAKKKEAASEPASDDESAEDESADDEPAEDESAEDESPKPVDDPSSQATESSSKRAKLKATLSKLGKSTKTRKNTRTKSTTEGSDVGPLPKPGARKEGPSPQGEDTPPSELSVDLGIDDDLVDTLSQFMPIEDDDELPDPEDVDIPDEVEASETAPGSEVETDEEDDDESLLIDLVDVVDNPEETEDEEAIGPDPDFQSGDTLTAIRPMSLASEAEDTPGLRMPAASPRSDDEERETPLADDSPTSEADIDPSRVSAGADDSHDGLFADIDSQTSESSEPVTSEREPSLDEPSLEEPSLKESGDEVTPAGDVSMPDAAHPDEDTTKQVSKADLQFIRSGGRSPEGMGDDGLPEMGAVGLQSETEEGDVSEAQTQTVHSELAEIWNGRTTGGVFGKGIIRPKPAVESEFSASTTLSTPHGWVYGVARLVERGLIFACGGDDTVSVYNDNHDRIAPLDVPEDGLNDITVVALGSVVFAAGDDGFVYAWVLPSSGLDDTSNVDAAAVSGHDGWVTSLDVDVDQQLLVTGSFDGTARIWALDGSATPIILDSHQGAVSGVAMTDRGPVTGGHDGTVRFWTNAGLQIDQLDGYGKILTVESGADLVAWASAEGDVHVRDDRGLSTLEQPDGQPTAIAIDARGSIATADKRGAIRLYAPGSDTPFQELDANDSVWTLDLTEELLIAGCDDGTLRFFER